MGCCNLLVCLLGDLLGFCFELLCFDLVFALLLCLCLVLVVSAGLALLVFGM